MNLKLDLYHHTPLKILSYFSTRPWENITANEIAQKTKTSRGGTNQALRILLKLGVISREKKANLYLYTLNHEDPLLKPFKTFEVLLKIKHVVNKITPYCSKIVLFGSCSIGTNTYNSDIDLFITTMFQEDVLKFLNPYRDALNIQPIIQTPLEIASSGKDSAVFFRKSTKE